MSPYGIPDFPIRVATPADELRAKLATDAEIEATMDSGVPLNEYEARTVLAALRLYGGERPGVYSAALKVETWLNAR